MGCNYTLPLPEERMTGGYRASSTSPTLPPVELSLTNAKKLGPCQVHLSSVHISIQLHLFIIQLLLSLYAPKSTWRIQAKQEPVLSCSCLFLHNIGKKYLMRIGDKAFSFIIKPRFNPQFILNTVCPESCEAVKTRYYFLVVHSSKLQLL